MRYAWPAASATAAADEQQRAAVRVDLTPASCFDLPEAAESGRPCTSMSRRRVSGSAGCFRSIG